MCHSVVNNFGFHLSQVWGPFGQSEGQWHPTWNLPYTNQDSGLSTVRSLAGKIWPKELFLPKYPLTTCDALPLINLRKQCWAGSRLICAWTEGDWWRRWAWWRRRGTRSGRGSRWQSTQFFCHRPLEQYRQVNTPILSSPLYPSQIGSTCNQGHGVPTGAFNALIHAP